MTTNSLIRALTVIGLMAIVGFTWFPIRLAWLKKNGQEAVAARKQASLEARKASTLAAFLYMVFMLSFVRFFL